MTSSESIEEYLSDYLSVSHKRSYIYRDFLIRVLCNGQLFCGYVDNMGASDRVSNVFDTIASLDTHRYPEIIGTHSLDFSKIKIPQGGFSEGTSYDTFQCRGTMYDFETHVNFARPENTKFMTHIFVLEELCRIVVLI